MKKTLLEKLEEKKEIDQWLISDILEKLIVKDSGLAIRDSVSSATGEEVDVSVKSWGEGAFDIILSDAGTHREIGGIKVGHGNVRYVFEVTVKQEKNG